MVDIDEGVCCNLLMEPVHCYLSSEPKLHFLRMPPLKL